MIEKIIQMGIEYVEINQKYWFRASGISEMIGIKNIRQSLPRLRNGEYLKFKNNEIDSIENKNIKSTLNNRGEIFIDIDSIIEIITNSRSLKTIKIMEKLGISSYEYKLRPREIEFLKNLTEAIDTYKKGFNMSNGADITEYKLINDMFEFETQYNIGKYRLDIFFYNADIIVEYDEYDHKFNKSKDSIRMNEVNSMFKEKYEEEYGYMENMSMKWIRVNEGNEIDGIIKILGAINGVITI